MQRSKDPHILSGAKVHTTALIVMPPKDLWGPINAIRSVHDKAYQRWMPHINMLYPFVPEKDFINWAPKLNAALKNFAAFELTFAKVGSFAHGANSTLFLEPDAASVAILKKIQARLELIVPICDDLSKIGTHGFAPHLTLGQWQGAASAKAAIANFNASWKPITFLVKELYCISRCMSTPFEVRQAVSLATPVALSPESEVSAPIPVAVVGQVTVSAAAARAPAPAPAPAAATKTEKVPEPSKEKEKKQEQEEETEAIEAITALQERAIVIPLDSKSEMAQVFKKMQSWYQTNKARKMLPKSRSKLEHAIKPLCQVFEDVDPMSVWNLLLADGVISITQGNKLAYRKTQPKVESLSMSSEYVDPKIRKPALPQVVEKAKQWISQNRDPPNSADGLKNCLKQLCHHKRTLDPTEVVNWLVEQKLVEETNDQIIYHLEQAVAP